MKLNAGHRLCLQIALNIYASNSTGSVVEAALINRILQRVQLSPAELDECKWAEHEDKSVTYDSSVEWEMEFHPREVEVMKKLMDVQNLPLRIAAGLLDVFTRLGVEVDVGM